MSQPYRDIPCSSQCPPAITAGSGVVLLRCLYLLSAELQEGFCVHGSRVLG